MKTNELRVIQDYEKLSIELKEQIKLVYPEGYNQYLISIKNNFFSNFFCIFVISHKILLHYMQPSETKKLTLINNYK
jgi:hypothetical protein